MKCIKNLIKIGIMILFINLAANEDMSLTVNKPANSMQFTFKKKNGDVLLLEEHMPKNERGNFFNIMASMRKAIAIHHPEALDEYDEAVANRKKRIDSLDQIIEQSKRDK